MEVINRLDKDAKFQIVKDNHYFGYTLKLPKGIKLENVLVDNVNGEVTLNLSNPEGKDKLKNSVSDASEVSTPKFNPLGELS